MACYSTAAALHKTRWHEPRVTYESDCGDTLEVTIKSMRIDVFYLLPHHLSTIRDSSVLLAKVNDS